MSAMVNENMRTQWTSNTGPGWVEHHDIFEAVLAPFNRAVIDAIGPLDGLRVLDVGCGTGSLSQLVVDAGGLAVGADISESMVEGARRLVPGARFEVADVQTAALDELAGGAFDRVVSRFGVMFFEDPVAAFANIRAATGRGGRLALLCWRSREENPMFTCGVRLVADRLAPPPEPPAADAPGPLAFADPRHVRRVLEGAGWSDIAVVPFDAMCVFGRDGSDGVEERMTMMMATQVGSDGADQLIPTIGEAGWNDLLAEVRADLRTSMVDGVLAFPGRTWIVTAKH